MIRSLPELPLCLNYLNASDCKRLQSLPKISSCLETPSNQTRGNRYLPVMFKFVNCVKLHKGTERNFFANFQRRVHNALPGILHRKEDRKLIDGVESAFVYVEVGFHTADHVILGFDPCWNIELPEGDPHTTVSFEFFIRDVISPSDSSIHHKVKCCGVSPVYAISNQDTIPNSFTLKFAASNEEECTQHGIVHSSDEDEVESICREQINDPQWQSSLFFKIFPKEGVLFPFLINCDSFVHFECYNHVGNGHWINEGKEVRLCIKQFISKA